ncbi:MAG: glycosyltransferase family 2 protein [Paludibacter sp.]
MKNQIEFTDLVTICIPVYERYDYFEESIDSALNQTVKCNVIVIDNASSHTKFKDFVEGKELSYLQYYRNDENVGMVKNWNRGIELSKTKWVSILHDDDALDIRFIEVILDSISKEDSRVAYSVECYIGPIFNQSNFIINNEVSSLEVDKSVFLMGNLTPFPGVVFDKEVAIGLGGFKVEEFPIQDLTFWYKLFSIGSIAKIPSVLAFYRVNIDQTSVQFSQAMINSSYEFKRKISKGLWELLMVYRSTSILRNSYLNLYKQQTLKLPFALFRLKLLEFVFSLHNKIILKVKNFVFYMFSVFFSKRNTNSIKNSSLYLLLKKIKKWSFKI